MKLGETLRLILNWSRVEEAGDVPGRESWRRPGHSARNICGELEGRDGKTGPEIEIDVCAMLDLLRALRWKRRAAEGQARVDVGAPSPSRQPILDRASVDLGSLLCGPQSSC